MMLSATCRRQLNLLYLVHARCRYRKQQLTADSKKVQWHVFTSIYLTDFQIHLYVPCDVKCLLIHSVVPPAALFINKKHWQCSKMLHDSHHNHKRLLRTFWDGTSPAEGLGYMTKSENSPGTADKLKRLLMQIHALANYTVSQKNVPTLVNSICSLSKMTWLSNFPWPLTYFINF